MKKLMVTTLCVLLTIAIVYAQAKQGIPKDAMERGKVMYENTCQACHQANGTGIPNLNPPLIKTEYVLGDKTRLINIVLKGLEGSIEVNGETYNSLMPSLSYLTDQQIADVLTYVRNAFGNKASAVTTAQVKAERSKQ